MSRWQRSAMLFEQSSRYLAGGVSSSLRRAAQPVPLFAERGEGACLYDVDGNRYVDYMLSYGPLIHGHAHPEITRAIAQQAARGTTLGVQHRGEVELAERLTQMVPCCDKVLFANSGTEAVQVALRLARAYTGRHLVIRFSGHYHGWADGIFTAFSFTDTSAEEQNAILPGTAGQSDRALSEVLLLPWNDLPVLAHALDQHGHDVAAVILEPVVCNSGCLIPRPHYLEGVRDLASRHNVPLIFDEVITGFRLAPGGAQERFGVIPDLCILGKAIAAGMPLSAVGGRDDLMDLVARGTVSHLGTLNGNPLVTAAANASLELLTAEGGTALKRAEAIATQLVQGLRELSERRGDRLVINQVGPVFHTMFTDEPVVNDFVEFQRRDAARCTRFVFALLERGVLVRPSGLWYVSTVHTEEHVAETLRAVDQALAASASQ